MGRPGRLSKKGKPPEFHDRMAPYVPFPHPVCASGRCTEQAAMSTDQREFAATDPVVFGERVAGSRTGAGGPTFPASAEPPASDYRGSSEIGCPEPRSATA